MLSRLAFVGSNWGEGWGDWLLNYYFLTLPITAFFLFLFLLLVCVFSVVVFLCFFSSSFSFASKNVNKTKGICDKRGFSTFVHMVF